MIGFISAVRNKSLEVIVLTQVAYSLSGFHSRDGGNPKSVVKSGVGAGNYHFGAMSYNPTSWVHLISKTGDNQILREKVFI